jgi:predicted GNAT family acetyltransferase
MDIQHTIEDSKGRFFIENDGEVQAEITYTKDGDSQISIDHTEVSEALRGQGIAKKLVEYAVNFARDNELKVKPICSYAKSVIESNESMQDVLK